MIIYKVVFVAKFVTNCVEKRENPKETEAPSLHSPVEGTVIMPVGSV